MIPILNQRCPKCGYLTLCELENGVACLGNDGCRYYNNIKKIKKIAYETNYTKQEITDIIIDYMMDTE